MVYVERTKYPYYFIILYALTYMGNAVYGTFISLYLDNIGFDKSAIGVLLSLGPFVAIVAQPIWGAAGDRVKYKNTLLKILILGSSITIILFTASNSFYYLFFIISLFTFFQTSVNPISDVITLEYLDTAKFKFGYIRMAGTLGFALMSVIAGSIANQNISSIFPLYFTIYMLSLISVFLLPKIKGHQSGSKRVSPFTVFKNKKFLLLMGLTLVVQATLGFYYSFFPIYYKQLGADSSFLGYAMLISSLSEIPFLFFADKILKKIGVEYTLVASSILMAIRWLLLHSITNIYAILFVQLFHGTNFIVFSFSLATYINNKIPKELKASGQAMNGLVSIGMSRIIGSMLGGVLSEAFGTKNMFLYNSVITAVTAIVFCFIFLRENTRKDITIDI